MHCAIGRCDFYRSPLNRRAKCRGSEICSARRHSTIAAKDEVLATSDKMAMPINQAAHDADQAVALQRKDVAPKRRSVHHELGGQFVDHHRFQRRSLLRIEN